MHILKDDQIWITAVVDGRWVQAKVYNEPSEYGVYEGRVSKLCIGKSDTRREDQPFFDQMAYNYDRDLDFCDLPESVVRSIVNQLERYRIANQYKVGIERF